MLISQKQNGSILHGDFQEVSSLENLNDQTSLEVNSKMRFVADNLGSC